MNKQSRLNTRKDCLEQVKTMNIHQTISIKNALDVITARMHVREVARRLGMNLSDQSRISLATSSLAGALGLGVGLNNHATGEIIIEGLDSEARKGLKVVCIRNNGDGYVPPASYFGNERWMVDEFEIDTPSTDQVKITMIKWASI